jgi:2-hydroxy-6-oxonona-2,4-dienedioate hydrolase
MNDTPPSAQRLTIDGLPVRCQFLSPTGGTGESSLLRLPLLLIHGLGCSAAAWQPTLRCLEEQGLDQPVVAPDMPGYGGSPGPPEALGIAELADWNARLLDHFGIGRAHVAGNSMGCQVALALARRHPERVGGLVLVGPTTGGRIVRRRRYLLGLLLDGARESLDYNRTLMRMYRQMGVRRYMATVRKMLEDDPLAHAAAVAAPALVVRGHADPIVPETVARRLVTALPRATLATIPGAAHAVQFTRPESFLAVALAFLAGDGASEGAASANIRELW